MSTSISTFREPVRVLIGDNDPDIQLRENAQIDAAIRTVVDMGKVTGDQVVVTNYSVTPTRDGITPDLTAADDPKAFSQLVLYTSRLFIADMGPAAWRTRAFSETVGNNYERIWMIIEDLWNLEFGAGMASSEYE